MKKANEKETCGNEKVGGNFPLKSSWNNSVGEKEKMRERKREKGKERKRKYE